MNEMLISVWGNGSFDDVSTVVPVFPPNSRHNNIVGDLLVRQCLSHALGLNAS